MEPGEGSKETPALGQQQYGGVVARAGRQDSRPARPVALLWAVLQDGAQSPVSPSLQASLGQWSPAVLRLPWNTEQSYFPPSDEALLLMNGRS